MYLLLAASEINVPELIGLLAILAFCLAFHESAHAWAALRCGDTTARDLGRITLNPIPHIDPIGTVVVPILLYVMSQSMGQQPLCFGWAKPVPVDVRRLRSERDWAFVAAAGPISNLILAFFGALFIVFLRPHVVSGSMGWNLLINFYMLNIVLAVFNMIPIPPLDGSRILRLFLPFEWKLRWDQLENWGLMLVMGFVYFGGTEFFIRPAINGAFHFVNWLIQVLPVSGA